MSIKSTTTDVPSQGTRASCLGVCSLHPDMCGSFSEELIPFVLHKVGCSATPWANLDVHLLQDFLSIVYPGTDHVVKKGDSVNASVSRHPFDSTFMCCVFTLMQANVRVMTFRNMIGMMALVNVKAFLDKFKDPGRVEAYVKAGLIYYGEIPFLYCILEPSDVPSPREKGGYKVVSQCLSPSAEQHGLISPQTRSGPFQSRPILETMLVYYGKQGIKGYPPVENSIGTNPIGALAVICTAVSTKRSTAIIISDSIF